MASGMRLSSAAFGLAGALMVLVGIGSILAGVPVESRELEPISGIGEISAHLAELSLPLSAAVAALVAIVVALLLLAGRLRPRAAAVELLVLGVAVEVCMVAGAQRIGYAPDGAVLAAAVAGFTGGAAILVSAFAAAAAGS